MKRKSILVKIRSYVLGIVLVGVAYYSDNALLVGIAMVFLALLILNDIFGRWITQNNRLVSNGFAWPLYVDRNKIKK
ncbi:hypothetical protein [Flavobacterium sp. 3HN19-14]|uniref:hypothetical protein n=1 Tax=Flavobacterium sp. 3HN19-14 TaxID=3448133 RepID=UPI003EE30A3D